MRYRRNGKQVLRGDEHVCDVVNEPMASVIVHALNAYDEPSPPIDQGPDLFGLNVMINPDVPPGTIRFAHPNGRTEDYEWNEVESSGERHVIKGVIEPPRCSIRQYADQYACATHKTQWDVDDTPPDSCEVP